MNKKLGVLLIRGAGGEGFNEQEKFIQKLKKKLKRLDVSPESIAFEIINWYKPTQDNQDKLIKKYTDAGYKQKGRGLGKFVLALLSDLVAYTGQPNKPSVTYLETHRKVHDSIIKLKTELEPNSPVILIASSLGAAIMSNYIWDAQNSPNNALNAADSFEPIDNLLGIFTLGPVTPVYLTACNCDEAKPIKFPMIDETNKFYNLSTWNNYFDKNDPLGFPLKVINESFNKVISKDIQLNAGNIFTSWNAASHIGYWKSRKIRNKIAEYLKKVLDRLD